MEIKKWLRLYVQLLSEYFYREMYLKDIMKSQYWPKYAIKCLYILIYYQIENLMERCPYHLAV